MKFNLRPYQTESVHLLRASMAKITKRKPDTPSRKFRSILCLPTGAGKTVTFSHLAEQAQSKGSRVAVVCHRKELIDQAKTTMIAYGINPLMISYGMVQTYIRSPHKIPKMDVCIIDECHIGNFRRFIELLPDTVRIIGATATPISASKKQPLRDIFDDVVSPVQIIELIEGGFLSKASYKLWKIDESKLEKVAGEFSDVSQSRVFSIKNLIEAYNDRVGKTIIFTSSIAQTLAAAEAIGGDDTFVVHSKMKEADRDAVVALYKATPDATIVNCGVLTAGFDEPPLQTVIVYRATTSLALWLQMCGRGSRVIPNVKTKFFIYDLGNNTTRLGAWELNRDWAAIFDLQGRKIKDKEAPMKKCVECEGVIYASAKICPLCQAKQPIKEHKEQVADRIVVIDDYSELPTHLKINYSEMTVPQLIERAAYGSPKTGLPYKSGWIIRQLKERDNFPEALSQYASIKGYKSGWILRQLQYS